MIADSPHSSNQLRKDRRPFAARAGRNVRRSFDDDLATKRNQKSRGGRFLSRALGLRGLEPLENGTNLANTLVQLLLLSRSGLLCFLRLRALVSVIDAMKSMVRNLNAAAQPPHAIAPTLTRVYTAARFKT